MRSVHVRLEDDLARQVDQVVGALQISRSAFAREALRKAIDRYRQQDLEKRHIEGYQLEPCHAGEFDIWESEHVWGD